MLPYAYAQDGVSLGGRGFDEGQAEALTVTLLADEQQRIETPATTNISAYNLYLQLSETDLATQHPCPLRPRAEDTGGFLEM